MVATLENKRVFIVEDQPDNYAVVKLILNPYGVEVGYDRRIVDMIDRLLHFAPVDIILMDLMFPNNISGFDLFQQIRCIPGFEKTPIVAISSSDPGPAMNRARNQGFAGFIAKPIDPDLFPYQIAQLLEGEYVWAG